MFNFNFNKNKKGNGASLGHRINGKGSYSWITYMDLIEQTRFVGSGLLNKGLQAINTTNIGIYSGNRPEVELEFYLKVFYLKK